MELSAKHGFNRKPHCNGISSPGRHRPKTRPGQEAGVLILRHPDGRGGSRQPRRLVHGRLGAILRGASARAPGGTGAGL